MKQGATLFVCDNGVRMAPAVHNPCLCNYQEATGSTPEEAEQWMDEMARTHSRYRPMYSTEQREKFRSGLALQPANFVDHIIIMA